jgi:hypothetical protein
MPPHLLVVYQHLIRLLAYSAGQTLQEGEADVLLKILDTANCGLHGSRASGESDLTFFRHKRTDLVSHDLPQTLAPVFTRRIHVGILAR